MCIGPSRPRSDSQTKCRQYDCRRCFVSPSMPSVYKSESGLCMDDNENDMLKQAECIALDELVACIEDVRKSQEHFPCLN